MDIKVIRFNPSAEYFFEEGCYILEHLNQSDDNTLSIARARVPIGQKTRPHRLRDTVERYLIIEGEGIVHLGEHFKTPLRAGDVVIIPAGYPQSIENTGDCELVFLVICTPRFRPEIYEDLSKP